MTEDIAIAQTERLEGLTRGLGEHALKEMVNAFWRHCISESHAKRVADKILETWTSMLPDGKPRFPPTPADIKQLAETQPDGTSAPRPQGCKSCDYSGLVPRWILWTKGEAGAPDTKEPLTPTEADHLRKTRDFVTGRQGVYQASGACDCELGRWFLAMKAKRIEMQHEEPAKGKRRRA